jgi:hypothetical protein
MSCGSTSYFYLKRSAGDARCLSPFISEDIRPGRDGNGSLKRFGFTCDSVPPRNRFPSIGSKVKPVCIGFTRSPNRLKPNRTAVLDTISDCQFFQNIRSYRNYIVQVSTTVAVLSEEEAEICLYRDFRRRADREELHTVDYADQYQVSQPQKMLFRATFAQPKYPDQY